MSDEIKEEQSDRGFIYLDPVKTAYGSEVRFYESSAAMGPHIWLSIDQPAPIGPGALEEAHVVAHMTLEQAEAVQARLARIIEITKEAWG